MGVAEDTSRVTVERILQSETFRSSDVLRRLLRFLAEKAMAGEGDQLKEYTIGLDAFGKPPTYDPRTDAIVRLQAGRLRQKLAEYYRTEGKDDPVIVDLPKGHFKLIWQSRPITQTIPVVITPKFAEPPEGGRSLRLLVPVLGAALALSVIWNVRTMSIVQQARDVRAASAMWTPELRELWGPFISGSRPLLLAFSDPIFAAVIGRDGNPLAQVRLANVGNWDEALRSPFAQALEKTAGSLEIAPRFNFVGRGYLDSALRLGKLLGVRQARLSVARMSQISWQTLSDNNVLLIGTPGSSVDDKLPGLPIQPELIMAPEGIRNPHPHAGEPLIFGESGSATTDGEILALVCVVPGPVGITRIGIFNSHRFWGNAGAIELFTDPAFAHMLVDRLKSRSGKVPPFYQVVLRVKYRDGVPTEVSYVAHRELPALPSGPARKD